MSECFASALAETQTDLEKELRRILPSSESPLHSAMRAAVLTGGKRLRPFLLIESAKACRAPREAALPAAAALECVHAYSLVHDDLPAMDDGLLRHGEPTLHRRFGQALAVLAGDALLTLAFERLAHKRTHPCAETRIALIRSLARASGAKEMALGQADDLAAPANLNAHKVGAIHSKKTAALFGAACEMGAIIARAPLPRRDALRDFGCAFGLAFQIADDLTEESPRTSLKASKRNDAPSLVRALGRKPARDQARRLAKRAEESLAFFGQEADLLRDAARRIPLAKP